MTRIKCFLVVPTGAFRRSLRRYSHDAPPCPNMEGRYSYHDASTPLDEVKEAQTLGDLWPHDDPRWPARCGCGYEFLPSDAWQLSVTEIYRRTDTGALTTLQYPREPGMMWFLNADYAADVYGTGPDGSTLAVQTPGGEWVIDSRANNCTRPDDDAHRCWVRHGVPPEITVDKSGGDTCAAGAGSILCGSYHGFLRSGYLEEC